MPLPSALTRMKSLPAHRPSAPGKFVALQSLLLAALTLAVYWPSLHSEFVYDARIQILTSSFIHSPENWGNVLSFRVLGMDVLDFNRPVHLIGLMCDAAIWGTNPVGYHLTSILLHAANTVLAFILIRKILPATSDSDFSVDLSAVAAFLCALLFCLHPIMVEPVCEPSYREDLLVTFFSLAAILLALGRKDNGENTGLIRAVLASISCLLAAGSKESGIAAPCLLFFCWILLRRNDRTKFWTATISSGFFLVAVFMAARFFLAPEASVIFEKTPSYPGGSFTSAMELLPRILVLYLQNLVWPTGICADYGILSLAHLNPLFCIILLLALALAVGVAIRRSPTLALAALIMVLPLLPVANLIPIYRPAADRYLYFPMVGVALALSCFLTFRFVQSCRIFHAGTVAILALALAALGWMNVKRQAVWHDSLALWQDTLKKNPNSPTAAAGLGEAFRIHGNLHEADNYFRLAMRLCRGKNADTQMMRAVVLDGLGNKEKAADLLELALDLDPRLADPDSRVATLAMSQEEASAIKGLLSRHPSGRGGRIQIDFFTHQLPKLPVNIED